MYGKWLYKEIGTEYGACMVEIYRKNYTGASIEIGALAAGSLSIALENLGSITDPIGKSVCSFSIIDTNQVEYDDFFTPDATALKVVVSTRVGNGAYVTRWSGYVTPDFFAENLSYRTPISISARDNIGYLNDVDFDLTATTITIREFIQSAFKRIAEDYPMSLSFVTQKQTAEGILAIDATISTTLLREMTWGEALETILHDLGLQMRWVDNNTIAVFDLSQIPEYYATQGFNFVDASGYREIVPAWRELSQKQEYGLIENFFRGRISEEDLTFVKEEQVVIDGYNTSTMRYYSPKNWLGNGLTINYNDYFFSIGGTMSESKRNRIYFTGISKDTTAYIDKYMGWRQPVYKSNNAMKISFKALNSIQVVSQYSLPGLPILQTFGPYSPGTAQFGLKVNVLLHSGTKTYIMRYKWEELNTDETDAINFVLPILQGNANEEECTIDLGNIPYDGELELRIYGWYFIEATNWTAMPLNAVSYITDVVYSYDTNGAISGRDAKVQVSELHNVKNDTDYSFGEVPLDCGGINAYAGGLYKSDGDELIGFQRNADATNYNLLELVGRELIHFNKRNYNRLSGTIRNLDKEPLMFNRLFMREGKKYAPYNYSLNVISNEMNITSMQEVEPYETATFNTIDSQITTGGGTVSGGNNTILQYSEEAGNEKRLYELQTATEQEQSDAYVLVDKAGFPEARKVHISELGGFDVRELEQYLESNGYATLKRIWEVDSTNAVVRTTYNVVSEQEIISCRRASGSGSGGGGGISEITAQMVVDALGYVPYSSLNPAGYITSAALDGYAKTSDIPSLSGYATENWVSNNYQPKGNYLTSVAWGDVSGKPTTLGGYGITDALSKSGGTINGRFELSKVVDGNIAAGIVVNADVTDGVRRAYIVLDATSPLASGSDYIAIQAYSDGHCDFDLPADGYINIGRSALRVYDNGNVNVGPVVNNSYRLTVEGTFNATTIYQNGQTLDKYYLPLSGGTISGSLQINPLSTTDFYSLYIDSNNAACSLIKLRSTNTNRADIGWYSGLGVYINNNISNKSIGIKDDGTPFYDSHTLIHSGNIGDYASLNGYIDGNTNFNALSSGIYGTINGIPNVPFDSLGNSIIHCRWDNNAATQLFLRYNADALYYRRMTGGAWADWKTIAFTSDLANYLPLSGGTLNESATLTVHKWGIRKTILNGNDIIFDFSNDTGGYGGGLRHITPYGEKRLLEFGSGGDAHMDFDLNVHGAIKTEGSAMFNNSYFGGSGTWGPSLGAMKEGTIGLAIYGSMYGLWAWTNASSGNSYLQVARTDNFTDVYNLLLQPYGGNVLIGTEISNGAKLQVVGDITATGEVISSRRASSSDARLKDNINRLIAEDCLAMVRNLRPSSWDWKENGEHSLGFIAQDIEPLMPYAVTSVKDEALGYKLNLQYDQFIALAIGGVQAVDNEVQQLKKEVAELKEKLSKYEQYGYNRY